MNIFRKETGYGDNKGGTSSKLTCKVPHVRTHEVRC